MTGPTQPTLPLAAEPVAPPRRRHRGRRWLIALIVLVVLLVAAALAGEWLARDIVPRAVKQQAVASRGVSDASSIDVDIPGILLVQLVRGTIDEATVSAPDLRIDDLSGSVAVTVRDLAFRGDPTISGGAASVTLDAAQLQALLGTVDGFPADAVGLADPDVTASTEVRVFGAAIPIGIGLRPGAAAGDLVLTPDSLTLADAEVSADELRDRLGGLADGVLREWQVCIAQYLPAPLALADVAVTGDRLVAGFDIAATTLTEEALQAKGTCS